MLTKQDETTWIHVDSTSLFTSANPDGGAHETLHVRLFNGHGAGTEAPKPHATRSFLTGGLAQEKLHALDCGERACAHA